MAARALPGLGLVGYWPLGHDGWKNDMDGNLRLLSLVSAGLAKSKSVVLPGSPVAGDVYIVPSNSPTNPNKVAIFDGPVGSESWVYFSPGVGWAFYVQDESKNYQWEGLLWSEFAGSGGSSSTYDLRFGFSTAPSADAVIDTFMAVRDFTFGEDLSGSVGKVGSNPASTYIMSLRVDGVEVATISISTSGVFTFSTLGATLVPVFAGSAVTLVSPSVAGTTIENMSVTLKGDT